MSNTTHSKFDQITTAFTDRSLMTTAELRRLGVSREYLRRLVGNGRLEWVARGIYRLPNGEVGENHSIVEAALLVSHGVVCLLSALRVHRVTTQLPFEVWMAVKSGDWQPRARLPIRFIRPNGPAFQAGIESHEMEGVPVRVYSLAKTVADCFKYRNKIGLDVALEAMRESLRSRRVTPDDLWRSAKVCRVTNVMRPYLEAID